MLGAHVGFVVVATTRSLTKRGPLHIHIRYYRKAEKMLSLSFRKIEGFSHGRVCSRASGDRDVTGSGSRDPDRSPPPLQRTSTAGE
jgi:hypothetical protein